MNDEIKKLEAELEQAQAQVKAIRQALHAVKMRQIRDVVDGLPNGEFNIQQLDNLDGSSRIWSTTRDNMLDHFSYLFEYADFVPEWAGNEIRCGMFVYTEVDSAKGKGMSENKVTVRVGSGAFIIDTRDGQEVNLTRDEALQLWDWLSEQLTRTFASGTPPADEALRKET